MMKKILLLISVLTLSSTIVAHADSSCGMTSPSDPAHLVHQIRNSGAFAAILDDGTPQCWGDMEDRVFTPNIPKNRSILFITGMQD